MQHQYRPLAGCQSERVCALYAGHVKEFGFWEVNQSTLLNIYEVPPPEATESLKGAASLDALVQKEDIPGASLCKVPLIANAC